MKVCLVSLSFTRTERTGVQIQARRDHLKAQEIRNTNDSSFRTRQPISVFDNSVPSQAVGLSTSDRRDEEGNREWELPQPSLFLSLKGVGDRLAWAVFKGWDLFNIL